MATPESPKDPKTPEFPEIEQELGELNFNVSKDYEKFETLSKDSLVKSGLNKIYTKTCEKEFSEEWKHFEKLHIGGTIQKILNKYPDLLLYVTGNLGLSLEEKKFSNLSIEQKLKFTALYQAIQGNGLFDKKGATSNDILKRVNRNIKSNGDDINRSFERENIKNFLDLEKTLKDFGLNSSEISKIKEYLLIVKRHPEFVSTNNVMKAGNEWIGYLIFTAIGVALGLLGKAYIDNLGKAYIDNLGKVEKETTINLTMPDVISIENPESVLKFMVSKGRFGDDSEHPVRGTSKVKMFTINDDDSRLIKWGKEKLNGIQNREIVMDLSGDVLGGFDLQEGCQIDIEENYPTPGKGVAYIQLPEPDIMILDDEANVVSENLERIHLSEFKNVQENLRGELRDEALARLKNNKEFYDFTKEEVRNNLLEMFKNLKPHGLEIEDVKIRFFDPRKGEGPIKINPHQAPLTRKKD